MPDQSRKYQTQWAAQFFAAAELTRRGNLVALTLGNAQEADLLVVSPGKKAYRVDVKGLKSQNFWLIQRHDPQPDLFYILVLVPISLNCAPEYFILSSQEMNDEMNNLKAKTIADGKTWTGKGEGINWGQSLKYKNQWDKLFS